jgi:hypothetical protein
MSMNRNGEAYIPSDCPQLLGETGFFVANAALELDVESTEHALIVDAAFVKNPADSDEKSIIVECGSAHLEPTVSNMHAVNVLRYPGQQAALLERLAERAAKCERCLSKVGICALSGNALKDTLSTPLGVVNAKPD